MKSIYRLIAASSLIAACFLAGCVTQDQLAAADFGPVPTDTEKQCRQYFEEVLKDPESARYRFVAVKQGWAKDGLIMGGKTHFGWVQIVEVNAKNSYGGYTGYKTHYLLFVNGRLARDITDDVNLSGMAGVR